MIRKDRQRPARIPVLFLGLLVFLAGCQPVVTATPLPTLATVRVQYTPALQKETESLKACSQRDNTMGLLIEKVPAQALDLKQADLSLRIGLPADGRDYAADLGKIEITVIAHPSLAQTRLTPAELASIYEGKKRAWTGADAENTTPVQGWTYLKGDDLRQAFDGLILGDQAAAKDLHEAPTPRAMVEAIARTPGAIGFIPKEWLDPRVKALQLDSPLSAPVLGLAASEPQGAARRLLACLQE